MFMMGERLRGQKLNQVIYLEPVIWELYFFRRATLRTWIKKLAEKFASV
jgi:hypothetical protein